VRSEWISAIGIAALVTVSGCLWRQVFYAAQGWQRNKCERLPEQADRERCLSNSSVTYEEYHRQAAGEKN